MLQWFASCDVANHRNRQQQQDKYFSSCAKLKHHSAAALTTAYSKEAKPLFHCCKSMMASTAVALGAAVKARFREQISMTAIRIPKKEMTTHYMKLLSK